MRTTIALAALFGFPLVLSEQAANASGTSSDPRVEEEIRRLNAQDVQAFLANDPKTLDSMWPDDMVVTNPLNKFVKIWTKQGGRWQEVAPCQHRSPPSDGAAAVSPTRL